ncbi:hypothetical protein D9F89_05080 [Escherichia coli]|nr:hypothetical protein [Escherichia coli]
MNSFLHQASFATGYWYYDRHRSVRLVILVGLAIDQIAQSGLSSLSVIYYSAQLFRISLLLLCIFLSKIDFIFIVLLPSISQESNRASLPFVLIIISSSPVYMWLKIFGV